MTCDTWFISDTHFGHEKTCTVFKNPDGSPLRPFANAEEMNEAMVERWNARVKEHDKVYHLGDVVISRKYLKILDRLNGSKRLVRGNHDIFKDSDYRLYFKAVYGVRVFDHFICSHIPLHPDSITARFRCNVHGHYHGNRVMKESIDYEGVVCAKQIDPRYLSVCVEQTDYTPLHMDEVLARIQKQFDDAGYESPKAWGNGHGPG